MKAVSLFAGVGGFDLALETAGVPVVASCEIDKHARAVLAKQFPNSTLINDVKDVTGDQLRELGFNGSEGIIVGGFPCQDLSVAGKRAGLAGSRSGLFWEICRILDETKAKWFILENVPGLLSSNDGRDMGTVIGALVERGYGVAYRILDAQHFGVAQRRRRVFIVGCLGNDGSAPSEVLALIEGMRGHLETSDKKRKVIASATPLSTRAGHGRKVANAIPAEIYHHATVVNQDVDSGHLVVHQE
jgi:DNA (cytosine-5)-methyltransferase 1